MRRFEYEYEYKYKYSAILTWLASLDRLASLALNRSPGELQAQMQICLQIRQSFMQQISLIPASERANFMLTVSPEVKRRLLMIKIWESYESKRGGRELKRVEKNTEDM